MLRPAATIATLAVVALLSGCSLLPHPHGMPVVDDPKSSQGELPASRFGVDSRPGLDGYYAQTLDWEHCAPKTECADVSAPMDWWHDRGGSIDLFVARHRATGTRLGTLVMDPGGPGQSGAQAVAGGLTSLVSADVARHYDVVGIDPRGVGYSTAIRCGGRAALDALYFSPTPGVIGSADWISATRKRSAAFADGCRSRSGELVDHVDSMSVARDLELLRRVMRVDRLDYLGYSYGTSLGQFYAGMFPDRVGRMVLDGVEDPWYSGDQDIGQGGGFETELDQFLEACLAGSTSAVGSRSCPYSGSLDDARSAVTAELASARADPVTVPDGRRFTDAVLAIAIEDALYSPTEWPRLAHALGDLRNGSVTRAMGLADEYLGRGAKSYYDNSNESFIAINCLDYGSGIDLRADARELRQLTRDDPVLGPYSAYSDLSCAGWDEPPSPFPAPVHAAASAPILVVGTTRDPATPYPQARSVARRLDAGHLVTLDGDGHTAYRTGSACIDRVVDAYLLKGTVPRTDPHCT